MVQDVRMNPYFDISSKAQICQKMSLTTLLHSTDDILYVSNLGPELGIKQH